MNDIPPSEVNYRLQGRVKEPSYLARTWWCSGQSGIDVGIVLPAKDGSLVLRFLNT